MTKEHIEVLLKIYLNKGKQTTKQLLGSDSDAIVARLEELCYIFRVGKNYHVVTPLFEKVFDNIVTNLSYLV